MSIVSRTSRRSVRNLAIYAQSLYKLADHTSNIHLFLSESNRKSHSLVEKIVFIVYFN